MLVQEPYSLTKPLLFSVYDDFSIPAINTGPDIGSEPCIRQMLQAAGFTDVKVSRWFCMNPTSMANVRLDKNTWIPHRDLVS